MLTLKTRDFIPEGYEIDKDKSSFEEIVFKKIDKKLITSWEEIEQMPGYYISSLAHITELTSSERRDDKINTYRTKKQAEAGLLLPQLLQVRDYLRDGWKPSEKEQIYVVYSKSRVTGYILPSEPYTITICTFSFQTKELADHFAKYFGDQLAEFYTALQ